MSETDSSVGIAAGVDTALGQGRPEDTGDGWTFAGRAESPPPDRVALRAQAKRDKAAAKQLLAPVAPAITRAAILVAVSAAASVVPFILIAEICRQLLRDPVDTDTVDTLIITAFAVFALRGVLQIVGLIWTHRIDAGFQLSLRRRLAVKASRLPLGWFSDRSSAGVKRLLSDDVEALHYLIAHVRLEYVNALVAPLVMLVYLFVVDWRLALVMLLPIGGYAFALSAMMSPANMLLLGAFNRGQQAVEGTVIEFVEGIAVIRTFGRTRKASRTFADAVNRYADALAAWKLPMTRLQSAADILLAPVFLTLVVTAAAVGMVALDWVDPLDLVPFLLVGVGLGASMLGLGYGMQALREGAAAARRIAELEATPELPDPAAVPNNVAVPGSAAETNSVAAQANIGQAVVRFDGVSFGYDPDRRVVAGIDVLLEPGTITALVGPSGSGKTTLARLLARFYDVDDGSIAIDGRDIRSMPLEELYATVGFVLQDVHLIRGTVADNLRLARPDATLAELEDATRIAGIHERISQLPQGFETAIGTGVTFSGGEAQRLSIARTLLADSRVLVLDEATAFADPESEAAVQDALASVVSGRTVLVIAHRLHTITEVDQILVLDDGQIAQRGTHAQLVQAPGLYQDLWSVNEAAMAALEPGADQMLEMKG